MFSGGSRYRLTGARGVDLDFTLPSFIGRFLGKAADGPFKSGAGTRDRPRCDSQPVDIAHDEAEAVGVEPPSRRRFRAFLGLGSAINTCFPAYVMVADLFAVSIILMSAWCCFISGGSRRDAQCETLNAICRACGTHRCVLVSLGFSTAGAKKAARWTPLARYSTRNSGLTDRAHDVCDLLVVALRAYRKAVADLNQRRLFHRLAR
jgi:hypothetical protein